MNVLELRQYTLYPGKRDVLIDLFEREFIEPQEAVGARIVGLFRDLDRPDRFVWIRGFADMSARANALRSFYGGAVWKAHRDEANATMIDSSDVLLLRPVTPFSSREAHDVVYATVCAFERPIDAEILAGFEGLERPLACLATETAENDYPALPVRTGENVVAWFSTSEIAPSAAVVQRARLAPTSRSPFGHRVART
jgi:hypothetical protein